MIYAFEWLSQSQIETLAGRFNPMMDYMFDSKTCTSKFTTYCNGYDGDKEIRKVRTFSLHQTKKGLICDEISEAQELCKMIYEKDFNGELSANYPWFKDYLSLYPSHSFIAFPVREFYDFYGKKFLDQKTVNIILYG